jgi:hypothetical protein
VGFRKLSYHGVDKLLQGFKGWENGESPSYTFEKVDPLHSGESSARPLWLLLLLNRVETETQTWRPAVDKHNWAVPSSFLACVPLFLSDIATSYHMCSLGSKRQPRPTMAIWLKIICGRSSSSALWTMAKRTLVPCNNRHPSTNTSIIPTATFVSMLS